MAASAPPKYSQSSSSHLKGEVKYSLVSSSVESRRESAAWPTRGKITATAHPHRFHFFLVVMAALPCRMRRTKPHQAVEIMEFIRYWSPGCSFSLLCIAEYIVNPALRIP